VGLTLVLLLAHAAVYTFLTDDAFISFRYARNLSQGYGLVFNPGFERVEGYTNFLWVLVLAAFNLVGLAPESVAHVLTIGATIVLWGVVVWFTYDTLPAKGRRWLLLTAPLFLAATRSVAVWSTSGLETRWFEVLVVGGILRLIVEVRAQLAGDRRRSLAFLLLALATLTRPDGLLISLAAFAVAGVQLAARRRLDLRAFAVQVGSYVLIIGAHYVFRRVYYGQWLPNTYYAKVGGQTWWDMGWPYLGVFALEYAAYLWVPLLVAAWFEHRSRGTLFTPLLFAAVVIPHALYVASIGGDHFEYRPLDLCFPFVFILLADGACRLARGAVSYAATLAYLGLVLVGLTALPWQSHRQFPDSYLSGFPGMFENTWVSADYMRPERDPIYRLPGLRHIARGHRSLLWRVTERFVGVRQEEHRLFLERVIPEGHRLKRLVEAGLLPADTHLATSCTGAIPYYSDLRVLDRLGLTDAHVAHSEFLREGRLMAHDKRASLEYGRRAGVDFWAFENAHSLLHVTHPRWIRYVLKVSDDRLPVYVADVGEGYYMLGFLPQGTEQAERRFPKLRFRRLADPEVTWTIMQRAIEGLRRRLLEDPEDDDSRTVLADTLLFTRDAAGAIELYEQVAPNRPTNTTLWYNLSLAYLEVGDPVAAVAAGERALKLAGDQADEHMTEKLRQHLAHARSLLPGPAGQPATQP